MIDTTKKAWYPVAWKHWSRSVPNPWQRRSDTIRSTHRTEKQFLDTERKQSTFKHTRQDCAKFEALQERLYILNRLHESALAECSLKGAAETPLVSAHLEMCLWRKRGG